MQGAGKVFSKFTCPFAKLNANDGKQFTLLPKKVYIRGYETAEKVYMVAKKVYMVTKKVYIVAEKFT